MCLFNGKLESQATNYDTDLMNCLILAVVERWACYVGGTKLRGVARDSIQQESVRIAAFSF